MPQEELGRIERPQADSVLAQRKIYTVSLVYPIPGAPEGYAERLNAYWRAVDDHVSRLESRAGPVRRVFHEGIGQPGQGGLDTVERVNSPALGAIRSRVSAGAVFEAFEDEDLFTQVLDWTRCLQTGIVNQTVAKTIEEQYVKASDARIQHLAKRLEDSILESEAALLIVASTRGLPLPKSAEVFNVVPPELDALERWVREANEAIAAATREEQQAAQAGARPGAASAAPERPQASEGGSKLWTPP